MPLVHRYGNIEIRIHRRDHNPPHFHVYSSGRSAVVGIEDGSIMAGSLHPATLRSVQRWRRENFELLQGFWNRLNG